MSGSIESLIRLACQAEALARKPGNVHPEASFSDLTSADFLRAADAAAPLLARSQELGVGRAVYESVRATRTVVASNANLGICLLLAPCAAAMSDKSAALRHNLRQVLQSLTIEDADWAYRAIRLAQPGGLGDAESQDISAPPTVTLLEAMKLAEDRDGVARQYATSFEDVFQVGVPAIEDFRSGGIETAIIGAHLRLMAARPDTLVARKCGLSVALESARRASSVLAAGWPKTHGGLLDELDSWLRADGHRRNPGTTADLVAATLFVALDQRVLDPMTVQKWCAAAAPHRLPGAEAGGFPA